MIEIAFSMMKYFSLINSITLANSGLADDIGTNFENVTTNLSVTGTGMAAISELISKLLAFVAPVAALALVILLMYGAFLMVTSQGNPEKLTEAKEVVTNAFIGFAVMACAVAILLFMNTFLDLGITPTL